MTPLAIAWVISLIVALGALPPAVVRVLAYRSGEIDHTETMRIAAIFAVAVAALGLVGLAVCSVLLLV